MNKNIKIEDILSRNRRQLLPSELKSDDKKLFHPNGAIKENKSRDIFEFIGI